MRDLNSILNRQFNLLKPVNEDINTDEIVSLFSVLMKEDLFPIGIKFYGLDTTHINLGGYTNNNVTNISIIKFTKYLDNIIKNRQSFKKVELSYKDVKSIIEPEALDGDIYKYIESVKPIFSELLNDVCIEFNQLTKNLIKNELQHYNRPNISMQLSDITVVDINNDTATSKGTYKPKTNSIILPLLTNFNNISGIPEILQHEITHYAQYVNIRLHRPLESPLDRDYASRPVEIEARFRSQINSDYMSINVVRFIYTHSDLMEIYQAILDGITNSDVLFGRLISKYSQDIYKYFDTEFEYSSVTDVRSREDIKELMLNILNDNKRKIMGYLNKLNNT